ARHARCFSMGNNGLSDRRGSIWLPCLAALLVSASPWPAWSEEPAQPEFSLKNTQETRNAEKLKHHEPDFTAKKRLGKASFYAKQFEGRPMADGTHMDPHGDNAASKTLPLGTKAKVTNLETGKSAVVTIQDRGPYVPGRVVDLSPHTARQIGITQKKGVA